jgi:hypothetical protein
VKEKRFSRKMLLFPTIILLLQCIKCNVEKLEDFHVYEMSEPINVNGRLSGDFIKFHSESKESWFLYDHAIDASKVEVRVCYPATVRKYPFHGCC